MVKLDLRITEQMQKTEHTFPFLKGGRGGSEIRQGRNKSTKWMKSDRSDEIAAAVVSERLITSCTYSPRTANSEAHGPFVV